MATTVLARGGGHIFRRLGVINVCLNCHMGTVDTSIPTVGASVDRESIHRKSRMGHRYEYRFVLQHQRHGL